eukprot:15450360-Alexandrium_andersonii.AAC.1
MSGLRVWPCVEEGVLVSAIAAVIRFHPSYNLLGSTRPVVGQMLPKGQVCLKRAPPWRVEGPSVWGPSVCRRSPAVGFDKACQGFELLCPSCETVIRLPSKPEREGTSWPHIQCLVCNFKGRCGRALSNLCGGRVLECACAVDDTGCYRAHSRQLSLRAYCR